MRGLITTSIVIVCLQGSAQFYEKFAAELKAAVPSKQAVEQVIEKYQRKGSGITFQSGLDDDRINFLELKCHEYRIDLETDTSKRTPFNRNELSVYFSNNMLVHINMEVDYKTLLTYTDTIQLDKQIKRINNLYGSSFERDKIFTGFIRYYHEYDVFGIAWGLRTTTASPAYEPMENIFKLVHAHNLNALIQLAKSECNETKAYAAAGLYLLEKEDCDIRKEGKQLLAEIRISKAPLCFASGGCEVICGSEINDALSNYFLTEIRKSYMRFKSSQKTQIPVVY